MNNFFKIALLVVGAILLSVFLFGKVEAQESPKIFINELMWQGSSASTADEWIELYNDSDELVDVSGFKICDEYKNNDFRDYSCDASPMVLVEDGQIAPKGYFLIANNAKDHEFSNSESVLNIDPDVISSSVSLSNSNLKIGLRDKDDSLIDVAGNGKLSFFKSFDHEAKTYYSIYRDDYSISGDDPEVWSLTEEEDSINLDEVVCEDPGISCQKNFASPNASGRPKIVNFTLADDSYILGSSKKIDLIYEIEDTDDDFEKVEITGQSSALNFFKNLNTNERSFVLPKSNSCWSLKFTFFDERGLFREQLVDLKCFEQNNKIYFSEVLSSPKDYDWDKNGLKDSKDEWFELYNLSQIDCDLNGWYVLDESGKKYVFDRLINKGQFLVFYSSITKISLNNSGESLYLYDPSGKLVSQVKIPSLAYNISYSFIDGGWYKTSKPTPNAKNVKDEEEDSQATSSADEKEKIPSSITRTNQSHESDTNDVVLKKVIVRKISYNNASVYLKRKNEPLVPKMDGAIVLGASSERRYNPFNPKVFLLYLLAVLLLTSVFTYAFYRRE